MKSSAHSPSPSRSITASAGHSPAPAAPLPSLFDRYAEALSKKGPRTPTQSRTRQPSPVHSRQPSLPRGHQRSQSLSLSLARHLDALSPSRSQRSPSPSQSQPQPQSMKHTRTILRAERPRPRLTGVKWSDRCAKVLARASDDDWPWRQRIIRDNRVDDHDTVQTAIVAVLNHPSHLTHAMTREFALTFNAHYRTLLSLPHRLTPAVLDCAIDEMNDFSHSLSAAILRIYPELYSRDGLEAARYAVFEAVCPQVYEVLFALYKRKNYYKDQQFSNKIKSLQGISLTELGLTEMLRLDPQSFSGSGASSSENQLKSPSSMTSSASVEHVTLHHTSSTDTSCSSAPSTPAAYSNGEVSRSQPSSPTKTTNTKTVKLASPSIGKKKRDGMARLKTLTSFDRDILAHSERAATIAETLQAINQSHEEQQIIEALELLKEEVGQHHDKENDMHGVPEEEDESHSDEASEDPAGENGNHTADTTKDPSIHTVADASPLSNGTEQRDTPSDDTTNGVTTDADPSLTATSGTMRLELTADTIDAAPSTPSISPSPSLSAISATLSPSPSSLYFPHYPYHEAVLSFRELPSFKTPRSKLGCFQRLSAQVCECVDDYYKRQAVDTSRPSRDQLAINADDLLSILSFILIKARLPHLCSEAEFIDDFVGDNLRISQLGYFLAVLQASIELINKLNNTNGIIRQAADDSSSVSSASDDRSTELDTADPDRSDTVVSASPSNAPVNAAVDDCNEGASVMLNGNLGSLLDDPSLLHRFHFALPTPDDTVPEDTPPSTSSLSPSPSVSSTLTTSQSLTEPQLVNGIHPRDRKKKGWLRR